MHHKKKWSVATAMAVALAIYLTPTSGSASPDPVSESTATAEADGVVTNYVSKADQKAARAYWTRERMRNAKPLDMSRKGAPQLGVAASGPDGKMGGAAPVNPKGKVLGSTAGINTTESPSPQGFAYPFPFNRTTPFPTFSYRQNPWKVNGKVFFTQNGGNYVCSGTVVNTGNKNAVYTAGHCVSNGAGVWNSNTTFVPAYDGNASNCCPRGTWVAFSHTTSTAWHNNGDLSGDYASFRVSPQGIEIQNLVGAAGFLYNAPRNQQWVAIGYPAAAPFDGKRMIECQAAFGASDNAIGGALPAPMGIGCDMTGGSSGGSWQTAWGGPNGNSPGRINGVNSYKYPGSQPLAMYSPYFGSLANTVRCSGQPTGVAGC